MASVFSCRCSLIVTNDLEYDVFVDGHLVKPDSYKIILANQFSIQSDDMGQQAFVREDGWFQQQGISDLIFMRNNTILVDHNGIPMIKRVV